MIFIIADDLTGANDTGIQFAKNGYKTRVLILDDGLKNIGFENKHDVLVIDTETREVEEDIARSKLIRILKEIKVTEEDIVYKKIDSTLRGNVGAEIEEIIKIFNKQFCILSPSFPSLERVTVGGNLIVQGKPLGRSAYTDNRFNIAESYIPSILKKQTGLSIERIDLNEVRRGQYNIVRLIDNLVKEKKKIIVIDSSNENHLRDIALSGIRFGDKVLFSGSGGLANYLVGNFNKKKESDIDIRNNKEPILIVGGSKNPLMLDQINYIINHMKFAKLKIDIKQIFYQEKKILDDYVNKCLEIIMNKDNLIIYIDAVYNKKELIDEKLIHEYKLSYFELGNKIKEFFGKLAARVVRESKIKNLVLTGGDIAVSVCRQLNISELELIGELLPGIPLSSVHFKDINLNLITKAGGFGKKETLFELINKFRNSNKKQYKKEEV
jgi:D-threonate/D-erythronate kinase